MRRAAINQFFQKLFTPREFSRWVLGREFVASFTLAGELPTESESAADYFDQVIGTLERHNLLRTHAFYCDLLAVRPRSAAGIAVLAEGVGAKRAAAVAREVASHVGERLEHIEADAQQRSRATLIRALDRELQARANLPAGAPARERIEVDIAALCRAILAGPRRTGTRRDGPQVPVRPPPLALVTPIAPESARASEGGLVVFVKAVVVTFLAGAAVLLAFRELVHEFGPPRDGGIVVPAPPVAVREPLPVPTAPRELEPSVPVAPEESDASPPVVPPVRTASSRPKRTRANSRELPAPVRPSTPPLLTGLSAERVSDGLAPMLAWFDGRDFSLRLRVRPDGTIDDDKVVVSTTYGRARQQLADLRFPPTRHGSPEVLCYVVVDDLGGRTTPRFQCGAP